MSLTKVTMFLEQPREFPTGQGSRNSTYKHHGWTENFHLDGDVVANASVQDKCVELCRLRAKLLPGAGFVKAVRLQKVDPVGKTKLIKAYHAGKVLAASEGKAQDDPENCLLINCGTEASTNRRIVTIRGIPDDRLNGGYYVHEAAYHRDLVAFFKHLTDNGFGFRGKDMSGAVRDIVSIAGGAITLRSPLALEVGNRVQVLRAITTGHRLKGITTEIISVTAPVAPAVTPHIFGLRDWPHAAATGGKLRVVPETPYKFFALEVDQRSLRNPEVGNRDTGTPSGLPRGRRPAKYA